MCVCLTYPINLGFEYFLTSQHHKVFHSYLVYCLLHSQNQNQNISLVPFIGGWDWKQTSVHDVCLRYWSIIFSGEPSSFKRKKNGQKQEHSCIWRVNYYTWTSPDSQYKNQIDYILCNQRWRSSIQSAQTRPGADCGSDRELFIAIPPGRALILKRWFLSWEVCPWDLILSYLMEKLYPSLHPNT